MARGNSRNFWVVAAVGLVVLVSLGVGFRTISDYSEALIGDGDVIMPIQGVDWNVKKDQAEFQRSFDAPSYVNGTQEAAEKHSSSRNRTGKEQSKQQTPEMRPKATVLAPSVNFSACLLIKDDNDVVSEWIAYNYHALKLRRLVVAVDPTSTESPSEILNQWRNLTDMEVFEWHDGNFMPEEFVKSGTIPSSVRSIASIEKNISQSVRSQIIGHRYRQRVFYAKCLSFFRAKGSSFVIHTDSDEYAVVNKKIRQQEKQLGLSIPPLDEPGSVLTFLQNFLAKRAQKAHYPCIPVPRKLFGSDESTRAEREDHVPPPFNGTTFETLRWRFHATKTNGHPKHILDVSAVPETLLPKSLVDSIHRPIAELCPSNAVYDPAGSNRPITLNHYLGSWEQYSARADGRRNKEKYDSKAKAVSEKRTLDNGIRLWLRGFIHSVGQDTAVQLLGMNHLNIESVQS